MYRYQDIKAVHLEPTSKCQARCPMCPRRINGGISNPFVEPAEITLHQFKQWFSDDFIKQLDHFNLCGNLGDPIVCFDILAIIKHIRSINSELTLRFHTNGSARNVDWWIDLASQNVQVVFGIDGMRDTHSFYRINTNWEKVIENATAFISAGGWARWDMLVFQHNAHQIAECKSLSETLGFQGFTTKHTSRFKNNKFDVLDDTGRTTHTLYPTKKSQTMISKVKKSQGDDLPIITCKAKKDSQIYVSANGNVNPCCWLDVDWQPHNTDSRIDYMNKISVFPNLNKSSLKEIFESGHFTNISDCWTTAGLKECSKQCGSFDKLTEQFICK